MKRLISVLALVIAAPVAAPSVAGASGSVSLELADDVCSLAIRQTFRKILASEDHGAYAEDVRKEMAAHAATILPALTRAVGGAPGRIAFDVGLPVVICAEEPCAALAGARFPAVVQLPALRFGDDARLEYVVGVAYPTRPTVAALAELRGRVRDGLAQVVQAEPGEPLDLAPLAAVEDAAPAFTLRVRSELWARRPLVARHDQRLAAVAKAARTRLDAVFAALPAGVQAIPCTSGMASWENPRTRLPAKLSQVRDGAHLWRGVTFCLGKLAREEALGTLREHIDRALEERSGL